MLKIYTTRSINLHDALGRGLVEVGVPAPGFELSTTPVAEPEEIGEDGLGFF